MEEDAQDRMLTLEQGRELIKNTSLAYLNDEELQELVTCIKTFCEICFEGQMNRTAEAKMIQINSTDTEGEDMSAAA